ncbi:dihydrolipoyl dehydrogenase [Enterobacteriaceae endosymbiont of Neohaemonia nigricornis]|uniref:dihydrolipoyl dehydrogenase n=1 Tax=Enterobacteriaceae endosymbiont of Neohaemonia nigricornis TaxID=2675792 RepID=UPI0014492A07|nr:dihydrolipoyl dehydrogenase [Enterobacteriaceae endosymbiont of Neohaemonia nigricornis]QJC30403.1 dihydrolipoyl dehydrogenase [Enterobacteriaceae endosymbiont of Neohaemonia nigricornis]
MNKQINTEVVVIGGGPAGYSAAFRCSDLGMKTTIIEKYNNLGGVCLNVGCIPSKSLLHISNIIEENNICNKQGIFNNKIELNIQNILLWKKNIINKLINGLNFLAKKRNINIINGTAKFITENIIEINNNNNIKQIFFKNAIIATGSRSNTLPIIPNDKRIWNSTDALMLKTIPKKMLILGAGIIGLEMATIYNTLGSKIDVVEISKDLLPEIDQDIINVYKKCIQQKFTVLLNTQIISIDNTKDILQVHMTSDNQQSIYSKSYDIILVAIGRIPNSNYINQDFNKIKMNHKNFICVDNQMRTNIPNIYAIGDVIGPPLLAHKGMHEGHLAAEVIAGKKHYFIPKIIPSIAYTNPEIGWVGITEKQAKIDNIVYKTSCFPWNALGRAMTSNAEYGLTKLIIEKCSNRIIGGCVIGPNAGELLGEISLAIEMGCDIEDIALTIHAHPTLYESIGLAAEILTGSITDILNITK